MKVILLRDVARIGRRYEIKEVPDGFALNKLIPQRDAIPATPANVKRVESQRQGAAHAKAAEGALIAAAVKACQNEVLRLQMEANAQGHLFQSVHAADVASALARRGHHISVDHIKLSAPIKSLGRHVVTLIGGGEIGEVAIEVMPITH